VNEEGICDARSGPFIDNKNEDTQLNQVACYHFSGVALVFLCSTKIETIRYLEQWHSSNHDFEHDPETGSDSWVKEEEVLARP
jgi:hypothetical protein